MIDGRQEKNNIADKWWRLNNLYWIIDEAGKRVKFRPNATQERLFHALHYLNIILKARQLGCTTFIDIFMLDECIINSNTTAGIIAHNLEDVKKIFQKKVKYPYDNLPEYFRENVSTISDSKTGLDFSNNSSIYVGTSMRSGTLQYLHVSEHGRICAKFPDKAQELRTGALNTVHSGQVIFDESTAEGPHGDYYDMCQEARAKERTDQDLSPMEFKFHFFPWYVDPRYVHPPENVEIPQHLVDYFVSLQKQKITLTDEQRAWYALKYQIQKGKMKQEYPSTPDEAFEMSLEGVIYEDELTELRERGRIGSVGYDESLPVHTFWDLGMDATCTLFAQESGDDINLIDYWEMPNAGMSIAAAMLADKQDRLGYRYDTHVGPHDIENRDWTRNGETRKEVAWRKHGIKFETAPRPLDKESDGIEAVKDIFSRLRIAEDDVIDSQDSQTRGYMLKCLSSYRRKYEEKLGVLSAKPVKDWANHCADTLQTLALWSNKNGKLAVERRLW